MGDDFDILILLSPDTGPFEMRGEVALAIFSRSGKASQASRTSPQSTSRFEVKHQLTSKCVQILE